MAEPVVYVYAVGDVELGEPPTPAGVGGAPVRFVIAGGLAAAVSSVDAAEFGEAGLARGLEDLRWLEETARAHHAVVDALAKAHPVVPLRLATVYFGDDNVAALLAGQQERLSAALDRVRGRAEWGVKAFAAAPAEPAEANTEAGNGAGPGTSYLLRRRGERDRARRSRERSAEAAERAHRRLAELAEANRRYPPQDAALTGYRDEMLLNAAYLVDDAGAAALAREVPELGADVLRLELTGPWAPYSFATLDEP